MEQYWIPSGMTHHHRPLRISPAEYAARTERLRDHMVELGLSGVVIFDSIHILYLTGFAFIPSGRPMAFVMSRDGERAMFVPRLEAGHARKETGVDRIEHYPEYPNRPHPMELLARVLAAMGICGRIGVDTDGYPPIYGYRGPTLSQTLQATVVPIGPCIEDCMAIKSDAEIRILRESCAWGNLAHRLLHQYTAVGATGTEASLRASDEATRAMLDALGPRYRAQTPFFSGAFAGYRGHSNGEGANPHEMPENRMIREGDVLISGAGAAMWGYYSELERTMIVGEPGAVQRALFEHMKAAQEIALNAIRPGRRCADVDCAVREYYEQHELMTYWKHHTGRGIGLRYYEGPFLDMHDHTEIRPGMVFAVEPGLYSPDLGSFRHSDTVVVTEDGIERLTCYPRDLESLIISAETGLT